MTSPQTPPSDHVKLSANDDTIKSVVVIDDQETKNNDERAPLSPTADDGGSPCKEPVTTKSAENTKPSSLTARFSSLWNANRKWQERRKWSAGVHQQTADDLRRESLVEEALRHDVSILGRRPDQVSITVERLYERVSWGCRFQFRLEDESIEIERVEDSGLLAIQNPCARYVSAESLLQPGDVLDSINGTDCHGLFLGDVQALMDGLRGRITFVFSTSFTETVQLCQAVTLVPDTCHTEALRLCRQKQHLAIQRRGYFDKWSVVTEGDSVVAVGDTLCHSLTPDEAHTLLLVKAEAAPHLSVITIKASPARRKWMKARKAAVALSGGALVGVGAVLMVSPLHPVGHAMAFSGVGVLGAEFDAPRRALQSVRNRLQSSDSTCSHNINTNDKDNEEEAPEMMDHSESSATSMDPNGADANTAVEQNDGRASSDSSRS